MTDKIISFPSHNYNERPTKSEIDMLVIHYTGMPESMQALERMCNPAAEVSAHYLIDEKGQIFQLISEDKRAWHAGISSWRNNSDINDRSIGIELANPGHEFGYQNFPIPQIDFDNEKDKSHHDQMVAYVDTMLELNNYFSEFRNLLDELDRSEFGQLAHPRMQTLSSNLEAGN